MLCEADALPAGSKLLRRERRELQILPVGGTSASVQAFGGIMALVNQKYGAQGDANYVLYPLAAKAARVAPRPRPWLPRPVVRLRLL